MWITKPIKGGSRLGGNQDRSSLAPMECMAFPGLTSTEVQNGTSCPAWWTASARARACRRRRRSMVTAPSWAGTWRVVAAPGSTAPRRSRRRCSGAPTAVEAGHGGGGSCGPESHAISGPSILSLAFNPSPSSTRSSVAHRSPSSLFNRACLYLSVPGSCPLHCGSQLFERGPAIQPVKGSNATQMKSSLSNCAWRRILRASITV
jgi:hypothetical protein